MRGSRVGGTGRGGVFIVVLLILLLQDFPNSLVPRERLRLGVGKLEHATIQFSVVHVEEGVFSVLDKIELDKSETTVLLSACFHWHYDLRNLTKGKEGLLHDLFSDSVIEATWRTNQSKGPSHVSKRVSDCPSDAKYSHGKERMSYQCRASSCC